MAFIMQFSLFKHFDTVLDAVEDVGLVGLSKPKVQKALKELDTFLPVLSNEAKLVFSYYYVYQISKPVKISEIEQTLNMPNFYLKCSNVWQELVNSGLLKQINGFEYIMPQKVINAVAIIDMEYYWPNEKTIIPAEHKKEVFWRLCHE